MKKLLLAFAFLGCLGLVNVNAQSCSGKKTAGVEKAACSKTCAKTAAAAAKLASLDESIEAKTCAKSGNVSYYQKSTCAKSGKTSLTEVKYCTTSQKFVNVSPDAKAMGVSGTKAACSKTAGANAACSKKAGAKTASLVDGKPACSKSKAACSKTAGKAACAKTAAAAAKLASLDNSIEAKTCAKSGNVSYYQKSTCAKSGKVSMNEVKYCSTSQKFVNASPSEANAKAVSGKKACSKTCTKGKKASAEMSSDDAKVKLIKN